MAAANDPIKTLERWLAAGGDWEVRPAAQGVTVVLRSCDGGSEMGRINSVDPTFAAFVAGLRSPES